MSTKKTKELFNEVQNYLKIKHGLHIETNYSDYNNKSSVCRKNPNFRDENGDRRKGEFLFLNICEFNVFKDSRKEHFIIWDKRVFQPFQNSKHCVFIGTFGRYEFRDRESFYNHILSDFGPIWYDGSDEDIKIWDERTNIMWDIKEGIIE